MKAFINITEKISYGLGKVSMLFVFIMMVFMIADICLRFIFNTPILGSVEIVEQMMAIIVFFSFAQTQVKKGHINVDILTNILPGKIKNLFGIITLGLTTCMTLIVSYATFVQSFSVMKDGLTSSVLYFPLYPFYFVVLAGIAVFCLTLFADFVKMILPVPGMEKKGGIQ